MSKLNELKVKDLTANEKAILNEVINKCKKLDRMEYSLLVKINELKADLIETKRLKDSAENDSLSQEFFTTFYDMIDGEIRGLEYALHLLRTK